MFNPAHHKHSFITGTTGFVISGVGEVVSDMAGIFSDGASFLMRCSPLILSLAAVAAVMRNFDDKKQSVDNSAQMNGGDDEPRVPSIK